MKLLNPSPNPNGYVLCCLYEDGVRHSIAVHILVARAFCIQKRPDQKQVNHIDSTRHNNRASNLEWNTAKEDGEHRAKMGRAAKGDRHGTKTQPHTVKRGNNHWSRIKPDLIVRGSKQGGAKINEKVAEQMRVRYTEIRSYVQVAREFGISESNTHRIIKGQNWKHVKTENLPRSHPDHKGTHNAAAKITPEIVEQIRCTYLVIENYAEVARIFQMSESQITRIIKRQNWKHVP